MMGMMTTHSTTHLVWVHSYNDRALTPKVVMLVDEFVGKKLCVLAKTNVLKIRDGIVDEIVSALLSPLCDLPGRRRMEQKSTRSNRQLCHRQVHLTTSPPLLNRGKLCGPQ